MALLLIKSHVTVLHLREISLFSPIFTPNNELSNTLPVNASPNFGAVTQINDEPLPLCPPDLPLQALVLRDHVSVS